MTTRPRHCPKCDAHLQIANTRHRYEFPGDLASQVLITTTNYRFTCGYEDTTELRRRMPKELVTGGKNG